MKLQKKVIFILPLLTMLAANAQAAPAGSGGNLAGARSAVARVTTPNTPNAIDNSVAAAPSLAAAPVAKTNTFATTANTVGKALIPDGFSLAYGHGNPNDLIGGRGAIQWDWNHKWFADSFLNLTGYWDASFAHWITHGDANGNYNTISIIAFAPVFRLQTQKPISTSTITPYLEASVGPSYLNQTHIGMRNLGGHFAFQDLIGAGIAFGDQQEFELSYHYLHYSNAGLEKPNQGIDVKTLLMFGYRFA